MSSVRRRAAVAGLVVVPVLVLLSGCKDDGSTPFGLKGGAGVAAAPATAPPTTSTGSPLGAQGAQGSADTSDLAAVGGVWSGTYHCAQGATAMKLALVPNGSVVTGTFEFTVGSTSGAYTVKGEQEGSKVVLHADQWLHQPEGFFAVDFEITSISPTLLRGTVDGEGCSSFAVTKSGA